MRLIDADELEAGLKDGFQHGEFTSNGDIIAAVNVSPTIDPVHAAGVYYCWECKHRGDYENCPAANSTNYDMKDYDFCSYGEKEATND